MLTLREPIKLNIIDGFTTVSEAFYERICGNYSLLTTQITPKELLFYLSAPAELPEDLGGMTTFAIQNNITDNRAVTMDVVNNVLNRIMLSQTNDFTYQDQVYIDSVLNKLGITDISLFMKQVQKLQSEHTDIAQLTKLYNQELKLKREAPLPEETQAARGGEIAASGEAPTAPGARYFLHSDIYKRLETKNIYDTVNAFQSEQSRYFGSFSKNELRTSEQKSVSNLLALSELRQQVFHNRHLTLTHAVNHFELGDMLPPPRSEEEVLSQAAAAALVSTVEHVLVQRLGRSEGSALWLSLENVLSETVENTISRFQSYHSGDAVYLTDEADLSVEQTNTYKNEVSALGELVTLRERFSEAVKSGAAMREAMSGTPLLLQQLRLGDTDESVIEGDSFSQSSGTTVIKQGDVSVYPSAGRGGENLSGSEPVPVLQARADAAQLPELQKTIREIQLEYDVRAGSDQLREIVFRQQSSPLSEREEELSPRPAALTASETVKAVRESSIVKEAAENVFNEYISSETVNVDKSLSAQVLEQAQRAQEEKEAERQGLTPAETVHPLTDAEAPPELIAQEVAEISRRNRERFQQLQGIRAEKIAESVPVPDQKRIMSDALRSLESPEKVLKEALGEQASMEHPRSDMPPEAQAYLAGADEVTRNILEKVMRLEQNPMDAEASKALREANIGELNAIATVHPPRQAEVISEAVRLEHETVKLTERADSLLEQYAEAPAKQVLPRKFGEAPPKVPIIHRQEQNTFSEELLERLTEQQMSKQVSTEVTDVVSRNEIHETVQNDITNKVVTQTSEDITQLVNRAISKQMNTISDKVYHQMEKRLQSERSRRGRF